jgi:hypothetical protein
MEPIELRTHTRLWQVEKKLYKLYDYTLPVPISIRMIGIFLLTSIPWIGFCVAVGIPFAPPFGHLAWITPPALLTYFGGKPVAEGKRLGDLLVSQVSFYVRQHRTYAGLCPHNAPDRVYLRVDVWRSANASRTTPAPTVGSDTVPTTARIALEKAA